MLTEQDTFEKLVSYLIAHGYPKETIAIEYKLDKFSVDLAIIDPKTNIPIQFFEVKSSKSDRSIEYGKEQLRRFLSKIKDKSIPTYLVFPAVNEVGFEIQRVELNQNNNDKEYVAEAQSVIQTINYPGQRNARYSEKIIAKKEKKDNTQLIISIICWIFAPCILVIGILNFTKIIKLTVIDLAILAGVLGIVLIPFGAKINILGIELELLKKEKKDI